MYCTYSADGIYKCSEQQSTTYVNRKRIEEHFAAAPVSFICMNSNDASCVDSQSTNKKALICNADGTICVDMNKRQDLVCNANSTLCVPTTSQYQNTKLCTSNYVCIPDLKKAGNIFELNAFTLTGLPIGGNVENWNGFTATVGQQPVYNEIDLVPFVQFSGRTFMNMQLYNQSITTSFPVIPFSTGGQAPPITIKDGGATVIFVCKFKTFTRENIAIGFIGTKTPNSIGRAFEWRIDGKNSVQPRFFHVNRGNTIANIDTESGKFAVYVYRISNSADGKSSIPQFYINNKLQNISKKEGPGRALEDAVILDCYIGHKPGNFLGDDMDVVYAAAYHRPLGPTELQEIQTAFTPVLAVLNTRQQSQTAQPQQQQYQQPQTAQQRTN